MENEKRHWLRGGIVSLVLFLILLVLSIVSPSSDMGNVFHYVLLLMGFPVYFLSRFIPISFGPFTSFSVLIIPYSFVVGALIGWIYGKIKKRKQRGQKIKT